MSASLEPRPARDASFERLYRRHRREIYGAVLRDVRDPQEAEDVTQIAFLNAFRAMRKGEEPDKPRAWLVTIARNVIKRRYRDLAHRPQEVALDPEIAAALLEVDGPTAGEIATAVRRLPPNQRAAILRREIQGRSYADIAQELGLSLAAVETLIFRARRSLSEELELADHAPATRRARWTVFLPLPGLGKISLGFSAGRLGLAALMGTALVALPVTDSGADPRRAPALERPVASAVTAPIAASPTSFAPAVRATRDRPGAQKDAKDAKDAKPKPAKEKDPKDALDSTESILETDALAPVPLPTVGLPSTDDIPLPPLPVEPLPEPPPLPELPPPPTL